MFSKLHITGASIGSFVLGIVAVLAYQKYRAPKTKAVDAAEPHGFILDQSENSTGVYNATGFNAGPTQKSKTFGTDTKEKVNRFGVIQNGPRAGLQAR